MERYCKDRKRIHFIHFKWRYKWYYWIVESLEKSGLLTDGVTQEVKEQEGEFLDAFMIPMAALLIVPMALHWYNL